MLRRWSCTAFSVSSPQGTVPSRLQRRTQHVRASTNYYYYYMLRSIKPTQTLTGHRLFSSHDENSNAESTRLKNSKQEDPRLAHSSASPTDVLSFKSDSVAEILNESIEILRSSGMPEPEESAVNLLAASLDLPWEVGHRQVRQVWAASSNNGSTSNDARQLPLSERVLTLAEQQYYTQSIHRRLRHEPIQYIVGQWDFLDYTLKVEKPLLCPRPETEELVLLVQNDLKRQQRQSEPPLQDSNQGYIMRILDVGCGTGCIGIALAAADCPNQQLLVSAIDVEPVAVRVASANAAAILGDDWQDRYNVVLKSAADYTVGNDSHRFDMVVSNPPYIPATDRASLKHFFCSL
jgi:methylase of polypeptide subunit release factors